MKNRIKILVYNIFLSGCLCMSCSTPQNVAYFQDANDVRGLAVQDEQQFRLRPGDKINIVLNSADPMLEKQFSLSVQGQRSVLGAQYQPITTAGAYSGSNSQLVAYTVDSQGDIRFPVLGKLSVANKTRVEVADYISARLIERDLVKDPIVTVEYVNMGVSVLGEVNKPGHINVTSDHFTILDALAYAGDLTINGKRGNILVSRQVDGEDQSYYIDLNSKQDILLSPAYYLQQNDVVYVSPNNKRMRESSSNANTMQNPSFWISVASLLTTITALIFR